MTWEALRDAVSSKCVFRQPRWDNALRALLRPLVDDGRCDPSAPNWLTYRSDGRRNRVFVSENASGSIGTAPSIPLHRPTWLMDPAQLTVAVVYERDRLIQYTVTASGRTMSGDAPWYVRVELDELQLGRGPCSHAILHCHVDPDGDDAQPRVPLPPLVPTDIVEWMLATVYEDLEPSRRG